MAQQWFSFLTLRYVYSSLIANTMITLIFTLIVISIVKIGTSPVFTIIFIAIPFIIIFIPIPFVTL